MSQYLWFLDTLARVLIDAEHTDGAYDLVEITAPSGHQPPPHVHHVSGEGWVVLDGELTVSTADGDTVLSAGQATFSPAGEAHTLRITSAEPCRMLVSSVPSGFAAFVRAFGQPAERDELPSPQGPPDIERLNRVAQAHNITMLTKLPRPVAA
ncbi:MAG: cupin domain-containing protein [Solirubrobacterales bacterium]|nr:cupin domain-containing protein [Solirubrobacterales bacterium]